MSKNNRQEVQEEQTKQTVHQVWTPYMETLSSWGGLFILLTLLNCFNIVLKFCCDSFTYLHWDQMPKQISPRVPEGSTETTSQWLRARYPYCCCCCCRNTFHTIGDPLLLMFQLLNKYREKKNSFYYPHMTLKYV